MKRAKVLGGGRSGRRDLATDQRGEVTGSKKEVAGMERFRNADMEACRGGMRASWRAKLRGGRLRVVVVRLGSGFSVI